MVNYVSRTLKIFPFCAFYGKIFFFSPPRNEEKKIKSFVCLGGKYFWFSPSCRLYEPEAGLSESGFNR